LTQREKEIVFYLTRYGYSNKHLASELFITEKTVKNHMAKIQEKTRAGSTRELLSLVVAQFLNQPSKDDRDLPRIYQSDAKTPSIGH
jgi:DNA-binding CsgD family transcriptional regulator